MLWLFRILTALGAFYMTWVAVATSLESNLFQEWSNLVEIPWMVATIKDFYLNMALVYAWAFYKERGWMARVLWLVLFVCLGSIATYAYVFFQLMKMKPGQPFQRLVLPNDDQKHASAA